MNETSFVRLARRFFQGFFWKENRVFSRAEAWLDIVAQCPYEPKKRMINGIMVEVPRGGIVATERFLSDRWMWSRTKVRSYLQLLEMEGMISMQKNHAKNHQFTMFLLCNFEKYNPPKNLELDQGKTTRRPREDQIKEVIEGIDLYPPPERAREILPMAQAIEQAKLAGVPEDFAGYVYGYWSTRGGQDGAGINIPFASLVKRRWNNERSEWEAGTHRGNRKFQPDQKRKPGKYSGAF